MPRLIMIQEGLSYDETQLDTAFSQQTYDNTIARLNNDMAAKTLEIEQLLAEIYKTQTDLVDDDYREQRSDIIEAYEKAQKAVEDAKEDFVTNRVTAADTFRTARDAYEEFFDKYDESNDSIQENVDKVYELQAEIENDQKLMEKDLLTANQTLEMSALKGSIADSQYASSIKEYETTLEKSKEALDEANEKLDAFEEFVGDEGIVYAANTGLVTEVGYSEGDSLVSSGTLISYATSDAMTISVDAAQEDVVTMKVGDSVDIVFSAYPDETYNGTIKSITTTDTSRDSVTVSYPVVISILGDTSKLYGGMTANVTFVTEQTEDIVYVPRKAVVNENDKTYVYKKSGKDEEVTYRSTNVEYGDLTVGITEDSTVSIGTLEQTFDLDISALINNDSGNSESSNNSGNGNMMGPGNNVGGTPNMMNGFSLCNNTYTSQSQEIEISEVHVTVGQNIKEGDVLYTLSEDSVNNIRSQLEEDVADTKQEYDAICVDQQESRLEAKQEHDTYVTNGNLAQLEYDNTVKELEEKVAEAEETLLNKQNQVNDNLVKLVELNQELVAAQKDLKDAQGAVTENYENRFNDSYYYTVYKNTRDMAQTIVDNIEDEIESLEDENETLTVEIDEATREWKKAVREQKSSELEAKKTLETAQYYGNAASEWYSIQTTSLDSDKQSALDSYEAAQNKLDRFDSYIVGNDLIAECSGVVTEVPFEKGDYVTQNSSLVTLYDQDNVTMDVSLAEDDFNTIDQDGKVNIIYTSYPDDVYEGVISDVSDAEYDSDTGKLYYTVTVTVQGDVSGLYEGMTGDVTFVTKETKEVNYVSNRAIFREGTRSYVKMYDENGNVVEKDVVTGFSDGINVEIIEGLSEGDKVLIESKISE